jgi:hypothetical protein
MRKRITPELMGAILDAGYNIDYIDAATIDKLEVIPYSILVIPPADRIPLSTYRKIESYASAHKVIGLGKLPSLAPGLMQQGDSAAIAALSDKLFRSDGHAGVFTESISGLANALRQALPPDVEATGETAGLGFLHRKLTRSDVYFIVNTGNQPIDGSVRFRSNYAHVEAWNPDSGQVQRTAALDSTKGIPLQLAPYESRVFVVSNKDESEAAARAPARGPVFERAKFNTGWTIRFGSQGPAQALPHLDSWTGIQGREHYSGEADYTRDFDIPSIPRGGLHYFLDFGAGTPTTDNRPIYANGLHALLDPPIREAAIIYINGECAGSLWHPPYRMDITPWLHGGTNHLEIRVYNTAINMLAGQPPHDYSALYAKYGKRFEPQDMDNLQPIPSGLLGTVSLLMQNDE